MDLEEFAELHAPKKKRWYDDVPEEALDKIRATKGTISSPVVVRWLLEEYGVKVTASTINAFRSLG